VGAGFEQIPRAARINTLQILTEYIIGVVEQSKVGNSFSSLSLPRSACLSNIYYPTLINSKLSEIDFMPVEV